MQALQQMIGQPEGEPADIIDSALETVRRHLGMEVAYLSEFVGDESVFRAVSAPGREALIKRGESRHLDEVYCRHIIAGRLPRLIRDTAHEALAMAMPITRQVPIGSHVSIPIRCEDGTVYGMFCCLSPNPNPGLNERDLAVMELFADLAATQVRRTLVQRSRRSRMTLSTRRAMQPGGFAMAYQPIFDLARGRPAGVEALCRFSGMPYRPPNVWFDEAAEIGLGGALEIAVAARALEALDRLPPAVYVSINASPDTLASGGLSDLLIGRDLPRIVLEVTEHASVGDYDLLSRELAALRAGGMRLAVDDAGAGYAGLQHILRLQPDIIKLDISLTRQIDRDRARRSLATALAGFARDTGATLVAEGIEAEEELDTLRALGVDYGQGYLLGRPADVASTLTMMQAYPNVADPARPGHSDEPPR